jgi:hypothetical protein
LCGRRCCVRGAPWKPIDTQVTRTGRAGFAYGNETDGFRSFFGSAAEGLVRFEGAAGGSLTVGVDGGRSGGPQVKDDTVTYPAMVPGAALSFQVTPQELKESVTLGKAPAGEVAYSFAVKADGLRAGQRRDGVDRVLPR